MPDHDAPFVRRLKEAGGILTGKTTTPEFGWKALSGCPLTGDTHNPWNTGMNTGGSSAGAGAAAAAGLGPLHQGSDGAGSIRVPSSFCGIFGHKPSYGRVPQWPVSNNDYTTHNGPMTRTVADAALMLERHGRARRLGPHLASTRAPDDYVGKLNRGVQGPARGVEPQSRQAARGSGGRRASWKAVRRLQGAGREGRGGRDRASPTRTT